MINHSIMAERLTASPDYRIPLERQVADGGGETRYRMDREGRR